jgi:hypothetical protein
MRKKILSLFLIVLVFLTFTACRKKQQEEIEETQTQAAPTVYDVLEPIRKMDFNTIEIYSQNQLSDGQFVDMKVTAVRDTQSSGHADIEMRFSIGAYLQEEYTPVTTLYFKEGNVYVNLKKLLDFIVSVDEQFIAVTGFFRTSGDYIVITPQDMQEIYEYCGIQMVPRIDELAELTQDDRKTIKNILFEALEVYLDFIAKESALMNISNETIELTINSQNMDTAKRTLDEADSASSVMDMCSRLENIAKLQTYAKQWETQTACLNSQLMELLQYVGEMKIQTRMESENEAVVQADVSVLTEEETRLHQIKIVLETTETEEFDVVQKAAAFAEVMKILKRFKVFF